MGHPHQLYQIENVFQHFLEHTLQQICKIQLGIFNLNLNIYLL